MPVNICVLAKQVVDPEMPAAAFRIDPEARQVTPPPNIPPVVNGFDENAVEAALQIKDAQGASITVISSGASFALDVMKKPLSMGADELVLLQDDAFANSVDSFFTVQLLTAAIGKLGGFDLIICGRQASDWTTRRCRWGWRKRWGWRSSRWGKKVAVQDGKVVVERLAPDRVRGGGSGTAGAGNGKQRAGAAALSHAAGDYGGHAQAPHGVDGGRPGAGRGAAGAAGYAARFVHSAAGAGMRDY